MDPIKVEEYKGCRIEIHQDLDPPDPRENDNLGTMACWHRRYRLGDVQPDVSPFFYKERVCDLDYGELERRAEEWLNDRDGLIAGKYDTEIETAVIRVIEEEFERRFVSLPLYLYDHSGITMATTPFSCPWDSGQVGFIYVRRGTEGMTDEQLLDRLQAEVEEYDHCLRGDVWGFCIFGPSGEVCDSCWGFVGDEDYALSEAKATIDSEVTA